MWVPPPKNSRIGGLFTPVLLCKELKHHTDPEFQTWLKALLIQFPSKALAFSAYLALGNKFLNIQHPFSFPWKNFKIPRSFSKPLENPPALSKALWKSRECQLLAVLEDKDLSLLFFHDTSPQVGPGATTAWTQCRVGPQKKPTRTDFFVKFACF